MMTLNTLQAHLAADSSVYQTPCYIYCADKLRENYTQLKSALGTALMVSIKANHCLDLTYLASHAMDGFEVASEFELNGLALLKSKHSFINNPSMSEALVRKAVAAKVHITLDHPAQIPFLIPLKQRLKPVFLRLSSALFLDPASPAKPLDHFGMDQSALDRAIEQLNNEAIKVAGIHIFRGSNSFEKLAFDTLEKLPAIIETIEARLGYALESINLGGGFPADPLASAFDFSRYREVLKGLDQYVLMHESGRGIFASAGYFMTTVQAVKTINSQPIIICDGGMAQNFLIAQTETPLKKALHPALYPANDDQRQTLISAAKIVGSSCNRDDIIGTLPAGSMLPRVGDKLIYSNCGAYNRSYSPIRFLGLPEAKEYILDA